VPQPQAGIIPDPSLNALFLILHVHEPATNGPMVAKVVAKVPDLVGKIGAIDLRAKLVCTVGSGSDFWDVLSPHRRPTGLRPVKALEAEGRKAPSTGGDLLFHILSKRQDLNFELARR